MFYKYYEFPPSKTEEKSDEVDVSKLTHSELIEYAKKLQSENKQLKDAHRQVVEKAEEADAIHGYCNSRMLGH